MKKSSGVKLRDHVTFSRDYHILKSFMQNIHRDVPLLDQHVANVHMVQFRPKEISYHHRPVALACGDNGLAKIVLKKVRTMTW